MRRTGARIIEGALGGAIGAACMTAVRMAARRRGVIDRTVSQTAEEWLAVRTGARRLREPAVGHLADQLLHAGYGAALGVAYALTLGRGARQPRGRGLAFGAATWLVGSWVLMPLLGANRAPWRKPLPQNAVDFAAHALFGVVTALVSEEMGRQKNHLPSSDLQRQLTRSG